MGILRKRTHIATTPRFHEIGDNKMSSDTINDNAEIRYISRQLKDSPFIQHIKLEFNM